MEDQAKILADLTAAVSSINAKLTDMYPAVIDLHTWRPQMEQALGALRAEVVDLRARVDDAVQFPSTSPTGSDILDKRLPADAPLLSPAPVKPAAAAPGAHIGLGGGDGHGQLGHGDVSIPRGNGSDDPRSSDGAPVKGKQQFPGQDYDSSDFHRGWGSSRFPPPPRVDFPLFDGENPRAWRLKCEAYFQVCSMSPDTWVSCAAMYFVDDVLS
jgi:hypothetical protein